MELKDLKKGDEIEVIQTQSLVFGYPVKAGIYLFESWDCKTNQCYIRDRREPTGKFLLIESKCITLKNQ
jgi:hypothetical protein